MQKLRIVIATVALVAWSGLAVAQGDQPGTQPAAGAQPGSQIGAQPGKQPDVVQLQPAAGVEGEMHTMQGQAGQPAAGQPGTQPEVQQLQPAGSAGGEMHTMDKGAGQAGSAASSMRDQCEDELRKDAQWRAELKQDLATEVHEEDARAMLTNKRHVVMAYAVLWIVVLVFVLVMWIRQRGLKAEIARLEREIQKATSSS